MTSLPLPLPLPLKVQTWSDDLRLPCVTDTTSLATTIDSIKELHGPSIPFQSKHLPALKRNIWFALKRPRDKSRSGLLCVLPEVQACLYISGEQPTSKRPGPRVALMRMRIDPIFLNSTSGPTVFTATLSAADRHLWIEDVLQWKGRDVHDESFQDRWKLVTQWIEHYCLMDPRLLGGLEIEAAPWQPLNALSAQNCDGVWELQCDEPGRRRLLWIANDDAEYSANPKGSGSVSYKSSTNTNLSTVPHIEELAAQEPPVAIAKREAGPDQWSLKKPDGTDLGRALIRKLDVSSALRSAKTPTVPVEIVWIEDFGKWEIRGIAK